MSQVEIHLTVLAKIEDADKGDVLAVVGTAEFDDSVYEVVMNQYSINKENEK